MLDYVMSNRPKVGRMQIIYGSRFNGTHIVLRIENVCFSGKNNKFSKFLAPPQIAIMGQFGEGDKHVHYLFSYRAVFTRLS